MAYTKKDWNINDIVMPDDLNNIEGVINGGDLVVNSIESKNKFDIHATPSEERNATYTVGGKSIRIVSNNNSASARVTFPFDYELNTVYTVSMDILINSIGEYTGNSLVQIRSGSKNKLSIDTTSIEVGVKTHISGSFTTDDLEDLNLWLYPKTGAVAGIVDVTYSNIQIEPGDTETEYVYPEKYGINDVESLGKIVVDDIKSKNMLDKYNPNIVNAYPDGTTLEWIFDDYGYTFVIEIEPNIDYTISKSLATNIFGISTGPNMPKAGEKVTQTETGYNLTEIHITSGADDKYLFGYFAWSNTETPNITSLLNDVQVERGNVATPYSEYQKYGYNSEESMGKIVVDDIKSKNLFPRSYINQTLNGVTCVTNEDGSITLNGTATANTAFPLSRKKVEFNGNYVIGTTTDVSSIGYGFEAGCYIYNSSGEYQRNFTNDNPNYTSNLGEYSDYFFIYFMSGAVFNNLTIYPQIEKGDVVTSYSEYYNIKPTDDVFSTSSSNAISNGAVSNSLLGLNHVSINDCSQYDEILSILRNNPGYKGVGSIGDSESSNLKTLLGVIGGSNYTRAIAKMIYDDGNFVALIEIYAFSLYGNKVRRGYITCDNTGKQWTGWLT